MLDGAEWEDDSSQLLLSFAAAIGGKISKQKRLSTPSVKHVEKLDRTGTRLTDDHATLYKALAAKTNHLNMDRADVAFAAKELCRDFSSPTNESVEAVRRGAKYLHHHPMLVYHYAFENPSDIVDCYDDRKFGGCVRSRRSTSGGVPTIGSHPIRHYASARPTLVLSSGETKLIGIVKGATTTMGLQS